MSRKEIVSLAMVVLLCISKVISCTRPKTRTRKVGDQCHLKPIETHGKIPMGTLREQYRQKFVLPKLSKTSRPVPENSNTNKGHVILSPTNRPKITVHSKDKKRDKLSRLAPQRTTPPPAAVTKTPADNGNQNEENVQDAQICGTRNLDLSAIIHGQQVKDSSVWPWQAFVRGRHIICGGTLIAPQWVLTAAHCINNLTFVLLGQSGLKRRSMYAQFFRVERAIVHQDYDQQYGRNDIALIKLDRTVLFNDHVRPACLPQHDTDFTSKAECYISGWGYTEPQNTTVSFELQELRVDIANFGKCMIRWALLGRRMISEAQICLKRNEEMPGAGACQGDSGGPLSCKLNGLFYVAGTASFVEGGCKKTALSDIYVKTSYYINWIKTHMAE